MILDKRFAYNHKQRRGNALSRNIRHNDGKVSFIHHEEVVEVASHLLGGIHGSVYIEFFPFGKCRKDRRKHGRLNVLGNIEFGADPFLFRCNL